MTPDELASRNIALMMTIAVVVGGLAYAGLWLVVKDHPIAVRFRALMSRLHILADDEKEDDSSVAEPLQARVAPVVMPETVRKVTLRIAEGAKLELLAALILESQKASFKNGVVPETRGLRAAFGVSPSSDPGSEYQRLRARLKDEITRQAGPTEPVYYDELRERIMQEVANGHE